MATLKSRRRRGISELMAAVVTIAMTLIAGAALFGYVNDQAASSENNLGVANASNVNFLNERFVVVDLAVVSGGSTVNLWIYNNGATSLRLQQITLYQGTKQLLYVIFTAGKSPTSGSCGSSASPAYGSSSFVFGATGTVISPNSSPLQITLSLPSGCTLASSTVYYANVLGSFGNVVVYSSCDSSTWCTM